MMGMMALSPGGMSNMAAASVMPGMMGMSMGMMYAAVGEEEMEEDEEEE